MIHQLNQQKLELEQQIQYGWQSFEAQSAHLAEAIRSAEMNANRVKQVEQALSDAEKDRAALHQQIQVTGMG